MSCPPGTTLQNGLCYAACPPKYVASPTDLSVCYDERTCASYGIGLTDDPDSAWTCNKPSPGALPCTAGYTQFGTSCYIRCPPSMTENSTTCIKRLVILAGTTPGCPTGSEWNPGTSSCETSQTFGIMVALIVIAILVGLYVMSWIDKM